jgi:hypothetical protein
METFWQLAPEKRLKEWRHFRGRIDKKNLETSLNELVDWWKMTPISSRVIDTFDNSLWPDPWELIYDGNFDENALALGMAYSLNLSGINTELLHVQCTEKSFLGLVVLVDNKYILNYNYGVVDNKSVLDNCEIIEKWQVDEITNS